MASRYGLILLKNIAGKCNYSSNFGWYQLNQQPGLAPPAATKIRNAETILNIFI
jgi:hypothetical protein